MFNHDESFFVEKEVAVPAEKAWALIARPGGLTLWHPFMEKHTAESWNGVGSKDHLTYYSGFEYDRNFKSKKVLGNSCFKKRFTCLINIILVVVHF